MRWVATILALMLVSTGCGSDGDRADLFGVGGTDATTSDDTTTSNPATDGSDDAPAGIDRSDELIGTWTVTFYALPDGGGRTNVVDGQAPVQIRFFPDGTMSHHTGCNAGSDTYATSGVYLVPESALDDTPEGQAIGFEVGMAEEQDCEGFLGEQNRDLPAAWRQAERFRLDGDRLVLSAEFFLLEAERS